MNTTTETIVPDRPHSIDGFSSNQPVLEGIQERIEEVLSGYDTITRPLHECEGPGEGDILEVRHDKNRVLDVIRFKKGTGEYVIVAPFQYHDPSVKEALDYLKDESTKQGDGNNKHKYN